MLSPVNCLYNYYSRDLNNSNNNNCNRWPFSDSQSRLKSGFSCNNGVSLPCLLSDRSKAPMQEQFLPVLPPVSAFCRDQEDVLEGFDTDSLHDKPFLNDLIVDNGYYFGSDNTTYETDASTKYTERYQPVEEPWLLLPSGSSLDTEAVLNDVRHDVDSLIQSERVHHESNVNVFSEREHPTEDPWLLYNIPEPLDTDAESIGGLASISEDVSNLQAFPEQKHQVSEQLISGRESGLNKGSVSTEILINCSVCTMQRIAVLEDGNLVELLLEPVKSNVQCDSVYLGVVSKLVPHMGGAFVNIGSSRPSLMDIRHNREPFIFPPFGSSAKDNDMNGASGLVDNPSDTYQVKQAFAEDDDDAELSDDDGEADFEDNDFEEHGNEDGIDVAEVEKSNGTGCVTEDVVGTSIGGFESHLKINGVDAKVQSGFRLSHVRGRKSPRKTRSNADMWALVRKGTKIVVQVVKEGLGTKGPTLTAYPKLRSRFWVLLTRCNSIGVSKKISGVERTRLRVIAKSLQPPGFGVTVRTVAVGHSVEELQKDLEGLLSTWRNIMEHAKSAALAADEGVEGAVPLILHQAMGQTLSIVQDYFNEKVKRMIVDSPRTYHEVTNYLQDIAPDLCDRVELHREKIPLFDEFNIEEEINNILNKRVALPNGGSLVIEQTEALVSIDVNGGHGMFGQGASQEKAILDVNLAAAKQIARELRLRDIGGIIVVDFIDMMDDSNKRLVYEEIKKAVERDRSVVKVSELSKHGLMEITRKRVRPSVTFMISEPCTCCHGTGRVEALETSFSKIEHEICSLLATLEQKADPEIPKSWPRLLLRVDTYMCDYLTSGKRTKLATLSSSLKVWILLKVARSFTRGGFEVKLLADVKGNNSNQQVIAMVSPEAESSKPTKRTKLFPVKKWKAGRK